MKRISLSACDAEHLYAILLDFWRDDTQPFGVVTNVSAPPGGSHG